MPKNGSKPKYSKNPSKKSGKAVAPTGVGAKGGERKTIPVRLACALYGISEFSNIVDVQEHTTEWLWF